jgi:hypothetical protein
MCIFLLSSGSQVSLAQTQSPTTSLAQSAVWEEFSLPDGRFAVSMPAKPKSQSIPLDSKPGSLVANILALDKEGESYAVTYVEFPNRVDDPTKTKAMLDGIVERELVKVAGQLINQSDVTLSGFNGRELRVEVVDGFWVDRFYLVGSRIYFVSAFVAKLRPDTKVITEPQNALIRKYFDSFRFKT